MSTPIGSSRCMSNLGNVFLFGRGGWCFMFLVNQYEKYELSDLGKLSPRSLQKWWFRKGISQNPLHWGWGINYTLLGTHILLMEEILHHPTCMKPCKQWDIYHINWCRISEPSTVSNQKITFWVDPWGDVASTNHQPVVYPNRSVGLVHPPSPQPGAPLFGVWKWKIDGCQLHRSQSRWPNSQKVD